MATPNKLLLEDMMNIIYLYDPDKDSIILYSRGLYRGNKIYGAYYTTSSIDLLFLSDPTILYCGKFFTSESSRFIIFRKDGSYDIKFASVYEYTTCWRR